MQHLRRVIRPTQRTSTNLLFFRKFAVHNILQYYFGTGQDDKKPGSIPSETIIVKDMNKEGNHLNEQSNDIFNLRILF